MNNESIETKKNLNFGAYAFIPPNASYTELVIVYNDYFYQKLTVLCLRYPKYCSDQTTCTIAYIHVGLKHLIYFLLPSQYLLAKCW